MNVGLLRKTLREVWSATLLFALGLFAFEWILARVLPAMQEDIFGQIAKIPFFRNILGALLGGGVGERIGPAAFSAIPWVHPVALSLLWAHEMILTTRVPAAEVDRGTADVLLSLPVSRRQVWAAEGLVWFLTGVLLVAAALAGGILGGLGLDPASRTDPVRLFPVGVNGLALYVAVGGFSAFVSSLSERRARAISIVFATVLASFFLNFLAQVWAPAKSVSFLGILHYYRPLDILATGAWPVGNIALLLGLGAALWLAGGAVFAHRDLK